jgi:hypothetical protein
MEKIVVLLDSERPDNSTIDFSCYLAELTGSKLLGILMKPATVDLAPSVAYAGSDYKKKGKAATLDCDRSIMYFLEECRKRAIKADVLVEKNGPSKAAIHESRFADLLVVSAHLSFLGDVDITPSFFVKHLLTESECPVVLAPESFDHIQQIVFCYDGNASALFAIKQFTYLFPQFRSTRILVLEIGESRGNQNDVDLSRTIEWLKGHYNHVDFRLLQGDVKDELFTYFLNKPHHFVVMGSFGRSILSTLFRRSAAEKLMETIDLPLFISHH